MLNTAIPAVLRSGSVGRSAFVPLIAAMREMPAQARLEVEHFFADPVPSDEGIGAIIRLVRDHGGLEYARNRADEFGRSAAEALLELPEGPGADSLQAAVGYVVERRN